MLVSASVEFDGYSSLTDPSHSQDEDVSASSFRLLNQQQQQEISNGLKMVVELDVRLLPRLHVL